MGFLCTDRSGAIPATDISNVKVCSGREDPTCSDSILTGGINAAHLTYFGESQLSSIPHCPTRYSLLNFSRYSEHHLRSVEPMFLSPVSAKSKEREHGFYRSIVLYSHLFLVGDLICHEGGIRIFPVRVEIESFEMTPKYGNKA